VPVRHVHVAVKDRVGYLKKAKRFLKSCEVVMRHGSVFEVVVVMWSD
tara:strand:+ start:305 stop:445 length:141 start_codon:yes stop_codon:yes gene_type:complete